jgi:transcriptional regulator with XRE-family HTH domain
MKTELLDRLRAAVTNRRVTQKEIELKTGVDQSQISRILKGHSKRSSENVQRLCKFAQELPDTSTDDGLCDAEAFEILSALLQGSPATQMGVVQLLRNFLALKRQYESDALA